VLTVVVERSEVELDVGGTVEDEVVEGALPAISASRVAIF
jgi:hypothetical protein